MKTVWLIGIGPGDPDALTLAAVKAIGRMDVFFLLEKAGEGRDSLIRFREEILARHAGDRPYRIARADTPARDRAAADYAGAVEDWRRRRTDVLAGLIDEDMADGESAGVLVWGDPTLYDGTLQSLNELMATGDRPDLAVEVLPGITSVQALTARHRLPLNRVGESITITTGRQIEAVADDAGAVTNSVVMLDTRDAYARLASDPGLDIYWGADVGAPDEVLLSGPLPETAPRIAETLRERRARRGWVMDSYILRRRRPGPTGAG
ncbi:precorrin-6A synthase (deacetylating) [Roseospira navarrensis]|uniref:Precorrin-6A synthase [deacetylating] n=1 Tax=Roseospira navarrensis TaxID=140058 RepID=A0A7X2D5V1_9PROT|nr:precorrin-6A synthase (deacetylating) [Roseospira navarrensis]MQX38062.1 precorrin-6A synthase (deacetylating) [Roseospira navarrensis]